ncbi:MAG: DNA topoisomerase I, partial [Muribaculaceae bacterium]|nr:DNA topoisomerase I [Muribaculaceae bacterium]
VAVRLLAERENEIKNFRSEPYYRISAEFESDDAPNAPFNAELNHRLANHDDAVNFLNSCQNANFKVADVNVKPVKKSPAPPFTTSTLQQEAARKLGFGVAQTMRVAQALYEAGHIT